MGKLTNIHIVCDRCGKREPIADDAPAIVDPPGWFSFIITHDSRRWPATICDSCRPLAFAGWCKPPPLDLIENPPKPVGAFSPPLPA